MKKYLVMSGILSLFLCGTLPALAVIEGEGNAIQTTPVYYPVAGSDQLLIGFHVVKTETTGAPTLIEYEFSSKTPQNAFTKYKLWTTRKTPYYATPKAIEIKGGTFKQNGKKVTFTLSRDKATNDNKIESGDYIWLTAEIVPKNVKPNSEIDIGVKIFCVNGIRVNPKISEPKGTAYVFPFEKRIVPYYRLNWMLRNTPKGLDKGWGNWSDEYLKTSTDFIVFEVKCDDKGNLVGANTEQFKACVKKVKEARKKVKGNARIILGFAIANSANAMEKVTANNEASERLIQQMIETIQTYEFEGIDIDWEYPQTRQIYTQFENFVAKLKPRLFEIGATLSLAVNPNYKPPTAEVAQQADFVNLMSYGRPGEHASYDRYLKDIEYARKTCGLPDFKIIPGVPFYGMTLAKSPKRASEAQGYAGLVGQIPNFDENKDFFKHPKYGEMSFNGLPMLKKKYDVVKQSKLGGIMIWAYDLDIPYTDAKSMVRQLEKEIPVQTFK